MTVSAREHLEAGRIRGDIFSIHTDITMTRLNGLSWWVLDEKNILIRMLFNLSNLAMIQNFIKESGEKYFFGLVDSEIFDVLEEKGYSFSWVSLYRAIAERNIPIVARLLGKEIHKEGKPENWIGESPIFRALSSGNDELLNLCLQHDVDVNEKDSVGCTVLDAAIINVKGNEQYYRKLISVGVDITSTTDDGENVLMFASEVEISIGFIQFLVEMGVHVNCIDMEGSHVLDYVHETNDELRNYLISVGSKKPETSVKEDKQ